MRETKGYVSEKNGKYYAQVTYYENDERKKFTVALNETNRKKAQRMADDLAREKDAELKELEKRKKYHLFVKTLKTWLKYKRNNHLAENTADAYDSRAKYITDWFLLNRPGICVEEVTPKDISDFFFYLQEEGRYHVGKNGKEGLSKRTVSDIGAVLRAFFKDAVSQNCIKTNPAAEVTPQKEKKNNVENDDRIRYMEKDEAKAFLTFLRNQPGEKKCSYLTPRFYLLYPIVSMCLCYGFRRSELLGLRWDVISENEIEIRRTVVRTTKVYHKDDVKTKASHRVVEITEAVRKVLDEVKRDQKKNGRYKEDGYVFLNGDKELEPDYLSKLFKKAVIACPDVSNDLTFHNLRYTCASLLFEKGWMIDEVAAWIGHSDIEVTRKIYTQVTRGWKKKKAGEIDDLFS